jgi:hypothetical protein
MDVKQPRSGLEAVVKQTLMILEPPSLTAALEMFRLTQIRRTTPAESFTAPLYRGFNPSRTALCLSAFHECDTSISTNTPVVGTVRLEQLR